jgi:thioredoxin 1
MEKIHPKEVNSSNFKEEVLDSSLPVVVDLWAPWCMPCRMITPIVEELANDNQGKLKVFKLNTDENQDIAARYGIQGIPTLLFFKDGKEVDRLVGVAPKPIIQSKVDAIL